MPHKMNTRSTERISGLQLIVGGYVHMLGGLAGDQWFEGDVSCSVVRRVALPDAFFAFDGMLETALHVVDEMGVYEAVIARELERFLPFLATTTLLMESVRRGAGRETAHEAIKEHAVAAALAMRQANTDSNLVDLLGADERIPLQATDIHAILEHCEAFVGMAGNQVDTFVEDVGNLCSQYPEAAQITKGRLL